MRTRHGDYAANNLHCGDVVMDVRDPRHEGIVEYITNGTARVRWIETGWMSECRTHDLRKI